MSCKPNLPPDLQSRDWLIALTQTLLKDVDSNIKCTVSVRGPSKILRISNISEISVDKLKFLTNTSTNNNYGYLEDFKVSVLDNKSIIPINVPDLKKIMIEAYNFNDTKAFLENNKLFNPFLNFFKDPCDPSKYISVTEFIDTYTEMTSVIGLPGVIPTRDKVKIYEAVFNPDDVTDRSCDSFVSGAFGVNNVSQCACGGASGSTFWGGTAVFCNCCGAEW
jgi:hypothetical protein